LRLGRRGEEGTGRIRERGNPYLFSGRERSRGGGTSVVTSLFDPRLADHLNRGECGEIRFRLSDDISCAYKEKNNLTRKKIGERLDQSGDELLVVGEAAPTEEGRGFHRERGLPTIASKGKKYSGLRKG